VIDWSDAALADPAVDLARLHRDLGPAAREALRRSDDGLIGGEDLDRGAFYARCALLQDLAYGARSGDERCRRAPLANLPRRCAAGGRCWRSGPTAPGPATSATGGPGRPTWRGPPREPRGLGQGSASDSPIGRRSSALSQASGGRVPLSGTSPWGG